MRKAVSLIVLGALLASGCASYTITDVCGRTTIDVENTGWELLSFIPLGSGNPEKPNGFGCSLFSDTVTIGSNMRMLEQAMIECEAYKANNIVSHTTSENVFFILLNRNTCHTSAELIKAYDDSKTCP